jgi:galactokinase
MSVDGSTLAERFAVAFGRAPEVQAGANGRVNLIGEHTDYNDGFVLPMNVPLGTRIELATRPDGTACVTSRELDGGTVRTYEVGAEQAAGDWLDYVAGVTWVLRESGYTVGGFEAAIETDLPLGSGLASSAALLVAVLRAFREACDLDLDDVTLARLAQRAEVEFVGARVGIMDQLAANLGDEAHALFVDTRSLEHERVPFPDALDLIVINSGVAHSNAAGDYNTRRAECENACTLLGVSSLRDVDLSGLDRLALLPDPLDRRARHVVTENQRVLDTLSALREDRLSALGDLLAASHRSMRDDYEVSVPEIDRLVALAVAEPDTVGARLTGGGFGGSILVLAERGQGARIGRRVVEQYRAETGRDGRLLVPQADVQTT